MKYPLLFSPIQINSTLLRNRIVMTAMHLGYTPGGKVADRLVRFYSLRARGGAGLIIVGGCTIDPYAGMADMVSIMDDSFLPGLERLTTAVIGGGARLGVKMITGAKAVEVTEAGLKFQKNAREELLPSDSIVIATGSKSENALASLKDLFSEMYVIGDAKKPRNALEAIREGFLIGLRIE